MIFYNSNQIEENQDENRLHRVGSMAQVSVFWATIDLFLLLLICPVKPMLH